AVIDAEAQEGRGRGGLYAERREVFDVDGLNHDDVAVTTVPRWRRRAQEVGGAHVIGELERSGRQVLAGVIARSSRQFGHGSRDIDDDPVPEARAAGRIRV